MIRAVVIDDEKRAREVIKSMLSVYCPHIHVVGDADCVKSGYTVIQELKPELVFLDIQMPDGTGFDLLKMFPSIFFKFVIITAYQEFAIKAFKFSAIDYILKPLDPVELLKATEKIEDTLRAEETTQKFNAFQENIHSTNNQPSKIVLRTLDSIIVAETKEIIRCESQSNYTMFHFNDRKNVLVSTTLKEFEDLLSSSGFVRTHQSHLVNLKYVSSYKRFPESHVVLMDGVAIPVSIRKRDIIVCLLKERDEKGGRK